MVNVHAEEGKDFIIFKRQLYQMYEVQNRSKEEHDAFSLGVERKNLRWLYKANLNFVSEMSRINHLDNLVAHGKLKGSIFKAKKFGPKRQRGLLSLALSVFGYTNMATMTMMVGPNVATLGVVATAYYGMMQFYDNQMISQIDFIREGENAGKLRMKVQKSVFSSYWVIVHPRNSRSVVSMQKNDVFGEELDQHIVHLDEYIKESTGERGEGTFSLPVESVQDNISLEWALAPKDTTTVTLPTFNDLVMRRHFALADTGGLTGLGAATAVGTGWSNVNTEQEVNMALIENEQRSAAMLEQMQRMYGKEKLDKMKPQELYRAYRDFVVSDKATQSSETQ